MPSASTFSPVTSARRPADSSTRPQAISCRPEASEYTTLRSVTASTLAFRQKSMPCFLYVRISSSQISGSVLPAILGSISMTVTFVPMDAK